MILLDLDSILNNSKEQIDVDSDLIRFDSDGNPYILLSDLTIIEEFDDYDED